MTMSGDQAKLILYRENNITQPLHYACDRNQLPK